MKQLTVTGTLLKGLVLASLLTGCQNDDVVTQNSQSGVMTNDRNAKTIFTPQLIKEGANELEYFGDYDLNRGKLKKLTNLPDGTYTEYQYNGQTIVAQRRKISTNALVYQVTYQLDASGRCVESLSTETNKPLKYEYGQLGRLVKVYNKNNSNERMEFQYAQNNAPLLNQINFFDQANTPTKEITYNYSVQAGGQLENKYPTNPDALGTTSKYLPLFGVFHSNLPTLEGIKSLPWNGAPFPGNALTYSVNSGGYVKTIIAISTMTNSTIFTSRTYTTSKL
ncbi:hypothetical protein SAMN05216327_108207 [Dyadobacter sp. SG02]|uniref:hypothetical protein n=1 Tax=Dyadobacter sp. SG02 TaxID=1855291 RepID=UPI0008AF6430|nr:hypothetical protein [Dyadobacter sp. SG02]SEJ31155.1 hypothetical protein SAMN05216327_108207 [Dyadobacter sp. SG02]